MENITYNYDSINTTLSIKTALILAIFVTLTTVFGISHGEHTDKTASKAHSYSVQSILKTTRREDNLS